MCATPGESGAGYKGPLSQGAALQGHPPQSPWPDGLWPMPRPCCHPALPWPPLLPCPSQDDPKTPLLTAPAEVWRDYARMGLPESNRAPGSQNNRDQAVIWPALRPGGGGFVGSSGQGWGQALPQIARESPWARKSSPHLCDQKNQRQVDRRPGRPLQ